MMMMMIMLMIIILIIILLLKFSSRTGPNINPNAKGAYGKFTLKNINPKKPKNNITYTSSNVTYDNFKTFAIKIVLGSASTAIIPKVKDMKAIALDF